MYKMYKFWRCDKSSSIIVLTAVNMHWRDLECQTINPCICNCLYCHIFLRKNYCCLLLLKNSIDYIISFEKRQKIFISCSQLWTKTCPKIFISCPELWTKRGQIRYSSVVHIYEQKQVKAIHQLFTIMNKKIGSFFGVFCFSCKYMIQFYTQKGPLVNTRQSITFVS